MTPVTSHDQAFAILRSALPGVRDLICYPFDARSTVTKVRSANVPPQPHVRGWMCRVPCLGMRGGVIAGSWVLPTTSEKIIDDAKSEVDRAIAARQREMVIEREVAA